METNFLKYKLSFSKIKHSHGETDKAVGLMTLAFFRAYLT